MVLIRESKNVRDIQLDRIRSVVMADRDGTSELPRTFQVMKERPTRRGNPSGRSV